MIRASDINRSGVRAFLHGLIMLATAVAIFGGPIDAVTHEAGVANASPLAQPSVEIVVPSDIPVDAGQHVTVPVNIVTNGVPVSAAVFRVDYDETLLTFDGNGLVVVQPGFSGSCVPNNVVPFGEVLDCSLYGILIQMSDGPLVEIGFNAGSPPATVGTPVTVVDPVSAGHIDGLTPVEVTAINGSVIIAAEPEPPTEVPPTEVPETVGGSAVGDVEPGSPAKHAEAASALRGPSSTPFALLATALIVLGGAALLTIRRSART